MIDKLKTHLIDRHFTIKQAMKRMNEIGEKEILVTDGHNHLIGAISDGDIRKWILKEGSLEESVYTICNKNPKVVGENFTEEELKELMLEQKIECVPMVNDKFEVLDIFIWDEVFAGKVSRHKEKLNIPVVIMAGGKGTRLDPFTHILPKPLIPIGEKPIIEIIMDKFSAHAVTDFYISVNHKARMIKSYFEESNGQYNIVYLEEDKPLGTVGALKLLENKISSPFLVTNCDVIIDSDYSELVKFHKEHGYDLTLVVSYRHHVIPYGVCEIESGGVLKNMKEKPEYDILINTGMYVINSSVLTYIPKDQFFNMTDLIMKAKESGCKIGAYPINEKSWIDIGQWEEYYKALDRFKPGRY